MFSTAYFRFATFASEIWICWNGSGGNRICTSYDEWDCYEIYVGTNRRSTVTLGSRFLSK